MHYVYCEAALSHVPYNHILKAGSQYTQTRRSVGGCRVTLCRNILVTALLN